MSAQRIVAFALIAVEAAVFYGNLKHVFFPASMLVIALGGVLLRIRVQMTRERKLIMVLSAGLIIAVYWRLALINESLSTGVLDPGISCGFAHYFLLLQVMAFFLHYEGGKLPATHVLYGIIVMTAAGEVFQTRTAAAPYQLLALVFTALCAALLVISYAPSYAALRARSRPYWLLNAILLSLALALGWGISTTLYENRNELDAMFVRLATRAGYGDTVGFSKAATLSSVSEFQARWNNKVVMRVEGPEGGYLRGAAYDQFVGTGWEPGGAMRALPPSVSKSGRMPEIVPKEKLFLLNPSGPLPQLHQRVYPLIKFNEVLFSKLNAVAMALSAIYIRIDREWNLECSGLPPSTPYRFWTAAGASPPLNADDEAVRARLTATPENLDPRIQALATRIFKGCANTQDKINAVVAHFARNYTYKFGIQIPEDEDPLTYFFLEANSGHCEFFASAAAILLRLGGVPCRYVTGFLITEQNPFGDYWVVRNEDAHAWVEAYDPGKGWVTVEATVASGLPDYETRRITTLASLMDSAKHLWGRVEEYLFGKGLREWVFTFADWAMFLFDNMFTTLHGAAAWLLLLAVWLAKQRRRAKKEAAARPVPYETSVLHRLLHQMDKLMRKQRLTRHHDETPHQFADRITRDHPEQPPLRGAAEWYRDYAVLRFRGAPAQEPITALEIRLRRCRAELAKTPKHPK